MAPCSSEPLARQPHQASPTVRNAIARTKSTATPSHSICLHEISTVSPEPQLQFCLPGSRRLLLQLTGSLARRTSCPSSSGTNSSGIRLQTLEALTCTTPLRGTKHVTFSQRLKMNFAEAASYQTALPNATLTVYQMSPRESLLHAVESLCRRIPNASTSSAVSALSAVRTVCWRALSVSQQRRTLSPFQASQK